jgi:hypothetical protein
MKIKGRKTDKNTCTLVKREVENSISDTRVYVFWIVVPFDTYSSHTVNRQL